MIKALRLIAAQSPVAGQEAMQCIRAVQVKSPMVQLRYNRVVELAFSDPNAEFSPAERQLIAAHIAGFAGENRTQVIHFRVSLAEYDSLRNLSEAAGCANTSEYLRSLIWPM